MPESGILRVSSSLPNQILWWRLSFLDISILPGRENECKCTLILLFFNIRNLIQPNLTVCRMILCQLCPLYVQFSQEVDRDRQTAGCPQDRKEILLNLIASLETREDKNKLEQALLTARILRE